MKNVSMIFLIRETPGLEPRLFEQKAVVQPLDPRQGPIMNTKLYDCVPNI